MTVFLSIMIFLFLVGCTEGDSVSQVEYTNQNEEENSLLEDGVGESDQEEPQRADENEIKEVEDYNAIKETIIETYSGVSPQSWGENIDGVITEIDTEEKTVALTFDACDGTPNSYDEELIDFLIEEEVPATLFIAGPWIEEHPEEFTELSNNPLFEIANHGYDHKPLSVSGESAYGVQGTENVAEVFDEIYENQRFIEELMDESPKYFRSGTAHYDDVAVDIANELGLKIVNYSALGDAGGTFTEAQIIESLDTAQEGDIYLFHMNQPQSDIASGVREGVMRLKDRGFDFVQLQEVDESLE